VTKGRCAQYEGGKLMHILICDNDIEITDQLEKILRNFFKKNSLKIPTITTYHNGEDLLLNSQEKDIVFLDMTISGVSGIHIGNTLKKENENIIIFIMASYSQFLDDVMCFHDFFYLPKPLDKQRIFASIKNLLESYNTCVTQIPIETKNGISLVPSSDIIFTEAREHKVVIHTLKGDYDSIYSMKYWLEKLHMPYFFYSHRSYIVNLKYVSDFDHSLIHLYNNRFEAYLTRRKYTQFKDSYLLYLESTM
jgi:two-component system, LytTR family, response regulator